MRNYAPTITTLAVVVLVFSAALTLTDSWSGAPQALAALPFELALLLLFVRSSPGATPALVQLVMAAAFVRYAAAFTFQCLPQVEGGFAPDAFGYHGGGAAIAYWWSGGPYPAFITKQPAVIYYYFVGLQYSILGIAPLLPKITNATIGAATVVYAYRIGTSLFGVPTGWRAANLVAFFPSLVLWSVLNIRDILAIILVLMVVWHTLALKELFNPLSGIMLFAALVGLGLIRDYLFPIMTFSVLTSLALTDMRNALRNILVVGFLGLLLLLLYQQFRMGKRVVSEVSFQELQRIRQGGMIGAKSAYLQDADISTPQGMILFLPLGIAYFLLSPFPWQVGGMKSLPLPEMLYWYSLIPALWLGMKTLLRHRFSMSIAVFICAVGISLSYGIGSSNVGTAFRHRGQVMPLLLIFAAAGLTMREYHRRQRLGLPPEMPAAEPSPPPPPPPRRPEPRWTPRRPGPAEG